MECSTSTGDTLVILSCVFAALAVFFLVAIKR